mmetsp:Transcript_4832/g.5585  ORF Transcript_4832/g.5585 Transcript_4832/m.5585 type:complete len:236 (-) Transcript_4832:67-774(-)|eukprot:CAMPEP_0204625104 /NCGR_PEP_ID=MMETSP0717-20131115/10846_1 /ASSEMBLY_ACC=CAM_ASM_000666 /TAXON_ID=230516 /ORGANISM="Chaetoceros curvisetus" /LENGTH=235 /DNA_ID=CAMNT_0051640715 /DNA_START=47 /DNA_END=754 /DNA_ORIENTATION=-
MRASMKSIVFLIAVHTGYSATYVSPASGGWKAGSGGQEESPDPFSTQDLDLLNNRIAQIQAGTVKRVVSRTGYASHCEFEVKSVQPVKRRVVERSGYVPQTEIAKPIQQVEISRPSHFFEDPEEIEVHHLDAQTSADSKKRERHAADVSKPLKLFNIADQNAKIHGLVKLLPQFLAMTLHPERIPILAITRKLTGFGKKEPESYVKLSPGYTFMTSPTMPKKRADTSLFSFRKRA